MVESILDAIGNVLSIFIGDFESKNKFKWIKVLSIVIIFAALFFVIYLMIKE